VHTFSHQTGFITEIVPDAFVIANDMGSWWTYFSHKYFTARKMSRYIGYGAPIIPQSLTTVDDKTRTRLQQQLDLPNITDPVNSTPDENFSSLVNDVGAFMASTTAAGAIAWRAGTAILPTVYGAASGATAISTGLWMLGDYLYYSWIKDKSAFFICPLIKRGSPWVAGMPWTANTSFIARLGHRIERWFTESREGMEEWHYAATAYREAIYERLDGNPGMLERLLLDIGETPFLNTVIPVGVAGSGGVNLNQ
jgi:hypothetical protein